MVVNTYCSSRGFKFSSQHPERVAQAAFNYSSRGSRTLFWPPWVLCAPAYSPPSPHTHTHNLKFKINHFLKSHHCCEKDFGKWQNQRFYFFSVTQVSTGFEVFKNRIGWRNYCSKKMQHWMCGKLLILLI